MLWRRRSWQSRWDPYFSHSSPHGFFLTEFFYDFVSCLSSVMMFEFCRPVFTLCLSFFRSSFFLYLFIHSFSRSITHIFLDSNLSHSLHSYHLKYVNLFISFYFLFHRMIIEGIRDVYRDLIESICHTFNLCAERASKGVETASPTPVGKLSCVCMIIWVISSLYSVSPYVTHRTASNIPYWSYNSCYTVNIVPCLSYRMYCTVHCTFYCPQLRRHFPDTAIRNIWGA